MSVNWRTYTIVLTEEVISLIDALQGQRQVKGKRSEIIREAILSYCPGELSKPGKQRTIYQEIEENERLPAGLSNDTQRAA